MVEFTYNNISAIEHIIPQRALIRLIKDLEPCHIVVLIRGTGDLQSLNDALEGEEDFDVLVGTVGVRGLPATAAVHCSLEK